MVVRETNSSSFAGVSVREVSSGALPFEEDPPNNLGIGIGLGEEESDSKECGVQSIREYIGVISAKKVVLTKDSFTKPPFHRWSEKNSLVSG